MINYCLEQFVFSLNELTCDGVSQKVRLVLGFEISTGIASWDL